MGAGGEGSLSWGRRSSSSSPSSPNRLLHDPCGSGAERACNRSRSLPKHSTASHNFCVDLLPSSKISFFGIILMSSANGIAMFIVGRLFLGFGSGASGTATPLWLAETLPQKRRGVGLSLIFAVYYAGSLTAAGITYRTSSISGNLSWRIPASLQCIWGILSLIILGFTPESPRWLAYKGRYEEAHQVVAFTHSNGALDAPETLNQYQDIINTLKYEKEVGEKLTYVQLFKTPSSRRRVLLSTSMAIFSTLSGNNIISYYLGSILDNAGVTDTHTQLEINIILSAWNLVCAGVGSQLMHRIGRRTMGLISAGGCTIFLFLLGGFTKLYGQQTHNQSGIYATVAMIFLFQGCFAFGFTNLTLLYPPEDFNYSTRSNGMALWTATNQSMLFQCPVRAKSCHRSRIGIFSVFVLPIGLSAVGYKLYLMNGVWDILQFLFIYYMWVETNGKSLEEIDSYFESERRTESEVQDLEKTEKAFEKSISIDEQRLD